MNAAIYCRVSTEDEAQRVSLDAQIVEAKAAVSRQGWSLTREYVDRGRSGVRVEQRDAYLQMLQDMQKKKFDVIVVKTLDRLMRSAKDWYLFVDALSRNGVRLYFYMEKKFYRMDDALLVGIKAILAEEFSRDLSKKANKAHASRRGKGKAILASTAWGFDVTAGAVQINEEEARIIRKAFLGCAVGMSIAQIVALLKAEGFCLAESTVGGWLRNPLYKGVAVMNKVHYDFDRKQFVRYDEKKWVYVKDAVPAIVSEELWEQAQRELDSRCLIVDGRKVGKRKWKSPLSGKIWCGQCGSLYWYRKGKIDKWVCSAYIRNGKKACGNRSLVCAEQDAEMREQAERLLICKDEVAAAAMEILQESLAEKNDSILVKLGDLEKRKANLEDGYERGLVAEDIFQKKIAELERQVQEQRQRIELDLGQEDRKGRLKELEEVVRGIVSVEMSLAFLYEQVEKVIVNPEGYEVKYKLPLPI